MNRVLTTVALFCLVLSSPLCHANDTRAAKLEQYVLDAKDRLQLTDDQIGRIAPVLGESIDRQLGILAQYGIDPESSSETSRRIGLRDARAMKKELEEVRSATLASVDDILTPEQLEEFIRMQDERRDEVRSRIRGSN
jgi:hypothetical protein